MIRHATLLVLAAALSVPSGSARGQSGSAAATEAPARYDEDRPSAEFHRGRRAAVLDALPDDAVAIVLSAPSRNRSADVDFQYRQSNALYYLTGMTEPGSALLLVPGGVDLDGRQVSEIMVVPERNPAMESWMGRRIGEERAEAPS